VVDVIGHSSSTSDAARAEVSRLHVSSHWIQRSSLHTVALFPLRVMEWMYWNHCGLGTTQVDDHACC